VRPRPTLALACLLAGTALRAAPVPGESPPGVPSEIEILGGGSTTYDAETGETVIPNASVRDGESLFQADVIHYNRKTETIVAIGHVTLTLTLPRGSGRVLASSLVFHRKDGTLNAEQVRAGYHPWYVAGDSADGTLTRIVIHHAQVTYNEPGKWRPTIKADEIIYSPGHYVRLGNSKIGVSGVAMVPLWHPGATLNASAALSYVTFDGGYRSSLGAIGNAYYRIPFSDALRVGSNFSLFTSRGFMAGPAGEYQSPDGSGDLQGYFRSGWIYDYGKRGTDLLDRPVPHERAYAEWRQQDQLTDNVTLNADVNWWSDSEVVRDFRPKDFYDVQQPDDYLESVYTADNYLASLFTRFNPNSYEPVQERLPEVRFDQLPLALGDGFYSRGETSAVQLLERPPAGEGPDLASDRLDLFYGVERPIAPTSWLTFTPVAGARVDRYSDTEGAQDPGGYTRALGEVGFDTQMIASGVFDYNNPHWDIDGLRHLVEPHLNYRYIPAADAGRNFIPAIDRQTFTTYLEPLDLGDVRYLDDLHAENTLRLGLDNILQTRDSEYGSRDLVSFDADEDLLFKRQPGQKQFDQIHTDFDLTPAKWLDFDVATIFAPQNLAIREVETGLTLKDGDVWTLHLGNDFLRHENDAYVAEAVIRLNEMYRVHLLSEYDDRQHLFPEQSVALEENLVNTWAIRYVVTLSAGPNRNGHFGFAVQLDLVRF
jgi:LPS-assembly protein